MGIPSRDRQFKRLLRKAFKGVRLNLEIIPKTELNDGQKKLSIPEFTELVQSAISHYNKERSGGEKPLSREVATAGKQAPKH